MSVNKKLQKKWEENACKIACQLNMIFKTFGDTYSPELVMLFWSQTALEVNDLCAPNDKMKFQKVLGLFVEVWRLVSKTGHCPGGKHDFERLLDEAVAIWTGKNCPGAKMGTLQIIWEG